MKFIGISLALHIVLLLSLTPVQAYTVDDCYNCISPYKNNPNTYYNNVKKYCCGPKQACSSPEVKSITGQGLCGSK